MKACDFFPSVLFFLLSALRELCDGWADIAMGKCEKEEKKKRGREK